MFNGQYAFLGGVIIQGGWIEVLFPFLVGVE